MAPRRSTVKPRTARAVPADHRDPPTSEAQLVAVLVDDDTPSRMVSAWRAAAGPLGVEIVAVGPHLGKLARGVPVDRTVHITDAVEYDGVVLAAEPDETTALFVQEAYRHHKTLAILDVPWAASLGMSFEEPGVTDTHDAFFEDLALHRHWDR